MRSISMLDALMTPTRQGILAAALLRSSKWWYLSELAQAMSVRPSTLQRDIDGLVSAGILSRRADGRRVYVKANEASPVFAELRGLLEKTMGTVPVLTEVLGSFGERVKFAMVYGSVAREEETAHSDVDLLLVGDVSLFDLVPVLRKAESTLGRPVNPTVFTEKEFAAKIAAGNYFLTDIMNGARIMLKGAENELEAMDGLAQAPGSRRQ